LLAHLAAVRVTRPGTTVSLEELVAVGWPGEHMAWDAAVNRLRVAISTLRKLGLKGYLRNTRGGYHLEPSVLVGREQDPAG
jgi:hypothetical protein